MNLCCNFKTFWYRKDKYFLMAIFFNISRITSEITYSSRTTEQECLTAP